MSVLVNGSLLGHLEADDRGLNYGDGLFETIAVFSGVPALWNQHISRLVIACDRLSFPQPDITQLLHDVQRLVDPHVEKQIIKILLTRGNGGRGYAPPLSVKINRVVSVHDWPDYSAYNFSSGVNTHLSDVTLGHSPLLAGIKHTSRLEQVMARRALPAGAFETFMQDQDGFLIEGSMSNIFIWDGEYLDTPDLTQAGVAGVIRQLVIDEAQNFDIPVRQRQIKTTELDQVLGIFITNSIIGIVPVRTFHHTKYQMTRLPMALMEHISAQARTAVGGV